MVPLVAAIRMNSKQWKPSCAIGITSSRGAARSEWPEKVRSRSAACSRGPCDGRFTDRGFQPENLTVTATPASWVVSSSLLICSTKERAIPMLGALRHAIWGFLRPFACGALRETPDSPHHFQPWFQDEACFDQKGRNVHRWWVRGQRSRTAFLPRSLKYKVVCVWSHHQCHIGCMSKCGTGPPRRPTKVTFTTWRKWLAAITEHSKAYYD